MKKNNLFFILIILITLASCKVEMICPAYQSYFLIDKNAQKDQFGYFAEDTLPRRDVFYSSLDKNGLVAKTSLFSYINRDWVREQELKTVKMDVIYPEISDSLLFSGDAMMYAEMDVVDSIALDSAQIAAHTFRYGADQKYYNWYFRGKLSWKEKRKEKKINNFEEPDKKPEKSGFFGFFKNLFKKRKKEIEDGENKQTNLTKEKEEPKKEGFFKNLFKKKKKIVDEENKAEKPKKKRFFKNPFKKETKEESVPEKKENTPITEEEDNGENDF